MRQRAIAIALFCGGFLGSLAQVDQDGAPKDRALGLAAAVAQEGPTERTVVTQDGAMYRGEVLEYVIGDHITLKLDSGEQKRILWADAAQISPPRRKQAPAPSTNKGPQSPESPPPPPPPSPPAQVKVTPNDKPVPTPVAPGTERTVITADGITYHGEVLEYEVGSHMLLKLATGDRRRIPWAEAKRISPPHVRGDADDNLHSPERKVIMSDGSIVQGELVESTIGEYTLLKLPNGQLRRLAWGEVKRILSPSSSSKSSPIPTAGELLVMVDNGSRIQGVFFEYVPDDHLVLRHASGRFRIIPVGTIKKIVLLGAGDQ